MAKRRGGAEPARQLRPDDSGWLAELRRARTDPIDLAEPGEERPAWADEATLQGERVTSEPDGASTEDAKTSMSGDRQWAPAPRPESSDGLGAPPTSAPPVSPAVPPRGDPPVWTLPLADPPGWTLALPDRPLSPPPLTPVPITRTPLPPPPARLLAGPAVADPALAPAPGFAQPAPVPVPAWPGASPLPTSEPPVYYHDITPQPFDDPSEGISVGPPGRRAGRRRGRSGPPRWAIVLPLVALVGGAAIGIAYRGVDTPAGPPAHQPTAALLEITVTSIVDEGSLVRLSWTDPTDGEALFVISEITPEGARPVREVPAGETETIIVGLDPAAPQYCFRVLAIRDGEAAASATACTPARIAGT